MELFTIENADKASVDVTLSKYDYNTVKEGQSVEITLGDNTYQGTVTKMSHIAVQNEKGTPVISATVSIDNPDEDIFLGVDAKVKIYAASAKNVVTLPVEVVNIGKERLLLLCDRRWTGDKEKYYHRNQLRGLCGNYGRNQRRRRSNRRSG